MKTKQGPDTAITKLAAEGIIFAKIVRILKKVDPEKRIRVIKAVAILLGIEP